MSTILFPEVNHFDLLFSNFVNKGRSDALNRSSRTHNKVYGISISSPEGYEYGSVEPTDLVIDYINNEMLDIRKLGCHFKAIVREDRTVLVIAEYDQILGGHWLAFIPESTLPEINNDESDK